ncbi:MAG: AMP-binding protein [Elusimicrobia bacterium]|nr:AMP-binding protein [Elusimicrobiota bacterium]
MNQAKDLYSMLSRSASKKPDATAFVTGDARLSYQELLHAVDRAADMFWQLGIRQNDRVAIVLRNSPEFVISYFALGKLRAVSVPLNFMVSKEDEVKYVLENSNAKGVVTENEFLKTYANVKTRLPGLKFIISADRPDQKDAVEFWPYLKHAHYHPQKQNPCAEGGDVVSILYTSGTTGHPKGVLLTHTNIISNARAAIDAFKPLPKDIFMCLLPMFHTFAWTTNVILPLMLGTKTLIIKNITPPKPWLQAMGREGVTIMVSVPQIYSVLAREARGFKKVFLKYWSLRKVRFCLSGAAPLSLAIKNSFEKIFNIPLLEGYGLTETSPVVCVNLPHARKHGSVGKPLPGVKVKIVDEAGRELKDGEEGEILVQGPNITSGYHDNAEATKDLFNADGWLKTGDIGVLDNEGFLFIRDRKKDMVIIKGLKVFPAQIEQIINHHPKIQESAVIGLRLADGNETMKCFVVPKQGITIDKHEVMAHIRATMDPYKRPKEVEIVSALPKNTLQKVLKRELIKRELEKRMKIKIA